MGRAHLLQEVNIELRILPESSIKRHQSMANGVKSTFLLVIEEAARGVDGFMCGNAVPIEVVQARNSSWMKVRMIEIKEIPQGVA